MKIIKESFDLNNEKDYDLGENIYKETYFIFDRKGEVQDIEFPEYDDWDEDYLEYLGCTKEHYQEAIDFIKDIASRIVHYDGYLQLSDNRTWWKIETPDDVYSEGLYDYFNSEVEDAVIEFEARTGADLYGLGRSGRHICVEDTWDNFCNYDYLVDVAEQLENDVVEQVNLWAKENA